MRADMIHTMRNGQIVESGSHDQLQLLAVFMPNRG